MSCIKRLYTFSINLCPRNRLEKVEAPPVTPSWMKTGVYQYSAILVPQRIDNSKPLVEVVMKGVAYLVESRFVFKPGIQHTITVVISKNPEQVKIEIGGEIEDWDK